MVKPIDIPSEDVENKLKGLDKIQKRELRQTIGRLNWISGQTRPHISFETCEISTNISDAKIGDILKANRII